jgi:hypothetical protein
MSSTRADEAAEQWARGLYALRSEPSPQDAYRWGYEQAERDLRQREQEVRKEERERIISMADALEYELPNFEQMKGVETLRKKLQAERPTRRDTAREGEQTGMSLIEAVEYIRNGEVHAAAALVELAEVREALDHLLQIVKGAGLPTCPGCERAVAAYEKLRTDKVRMPKMNEYAWVIERYIHSELYYWAPQAGIQWSKDHDMAVRFSRYTDAASVLAHVCDGNGRAAQHGWIEEEQSATEGEDSNAN